MARTDIKFGHKHLTSVVVRERTHEARGRGFERQWSLSACFSCEKSCGLRRATVWLSSGVYADNKKIPIFQPIFYFLKTTSVLVF